MSGVNEIDKPITVADVERVLGHKLPQANVLKQLFEQPNAQPTETCKWKRLAYNKNGIASPHDDFKMRATRKDCPTCGKRIEVVE